MNENERHNLDETFRTKIEQMSLKPPTLNFDGVRANTLQKSLQNSQSQNRWLKGSLIVMTCLLGACIYFLMNNKSQTITEKNTVRMVNVYKTDTIYLTKYETKYIKVPVVVYAKYLENKTPINESNTDKKLASELSNQHNDYSDANLKGKSKFSSLENTQTNNDKINFKPIIKENADGFSPEKNGYSLVENIDERTSKLSYNFLKSKEYQSDIVWKKPFIKFKYPQKLEPKVPVAKIPFLDRISLGFYYAPEHNTVDVRKDAIEAFGLGDEEISTSSNWGLRLGFKISKKVSLLTGIEKQTMNFVHLGSPYEKITAGSGIDGNPQFLRYTIFGVANIPTKEMTANPQVGSSIMVEGSNGHFIESIRIPVLLKYQFYERSLNGFGWRGAGLNFYVVGGGYYAIHNKQQLMIEVYEPNGHDFYATLNDFSNTLPYTGLNLGFGTEFVYGRNFQLFAEPYYQTTQTSLVKNMPIRTFVNGIGLKFGLNYQFSKK